MFHIYETRQTFLENYTNIMLNTVPCLRCMSYIWHFEGRANSQNTVYIKHASYNRQCPTSYWYDELTIVMSL